MTTWTPVQPLSDEPQDQTFWEPQQFKIGDRVRVRLSGECRTHGPGEVAPGVWSDSKHPEDIEGCTGVVGICPTARSFPCSCFPDHPIVVRQIRITTASFMRYCHLAACELEPLP